MVLGTPDGARFKPGDQVCALLGGGGYSELVTVPEGMVLPVPPGLSMVEAASLPEVWSTVYLNLQLEAGGIGSGDTLFGQAGASGVGLAAIQFGKLRGARVVTTVGSAAKADFVKKFGVDVAVNHHEADIRQVLAQYPPNVALDCVGGRYMGECLEKMAFGGRWIMIATLAGDPTNVNLRSMYVRGTRLIGTTLRRRTEEAKAKLLSDMVSLIWPKVEDGTIRPTIFRVFPIEEAEAAQDLMYSGKSAGKIVLTVGDREA